MRTNGKQTECPLGYFMTFTVDRSSALVSKFRKLRFWLTSVVGSFTLSSEIKGAPIALKQI